MTDTPHPPIRSVCVYCGSSPGIDPSFMEAANILGRSLAVNNLRLVYGGGNRGLMGAVARGVLENGGSVLGVIPEFLQAYEQSKGTEGLEEIELIVVPDMHTRKQMMFEQADAFVALPGGIGTLEELVEMQTWAQLDRHQKPIGILNVNDFWSPYVELLQHMDDASFLHNPERITPLVFEDANEIVPGLLSAAQPLRRSAAE